MQAEKKFLPAFNIFLSEDLSKEAFIHWTDELGERHRKKGGINRFHTLDERREAALALVAEMQKEYVPVSPVTQMMSGWVEESRSRWKKKSYQTFKSKIDCFVEFAKGRQVTKALLDEFFKTLLDGKHNTTYNAYISLFRRVFDALDLTGLMEGLAPVSATSTPAKYFQSHQIARIKKHLLETDPSLWLACEMLYYCFIRPGEMRLLRIADIHFDENKICISSAISKNKKTQFVTVPMAFRDSLDVLKHRSPNEFIFYKKDCTKPLPMNNLLNRFRLALTALGFGSEYKLYSWKHTGAVAAVRAGASLKELQIQLRHHSLEEVDKYIRQLGVNDLRDLESRFPAI